MAIKVAINGFGRIGRNVLRALYERKLNDEINIVAINDLGSIDANVHLTKYDTTHGRFALDGKPVDVTLEGETMMVNGDAIRVCAERDPSQLPWRDLDIDVVFECTGRFTSRQLAEAHIHAGAKKVIISAPGKEVDATVVYGVNHQTLKSNDTIISNASCTTNCLAPLAKVLHEKIGIESGLMVTIHSYTNDQALIDANHPDLHRARAAAHSIIPTQTGAAKAVGLVLPELNGKLDGYAVRVPTLNVSLVDLTFTPSREASIDEVNSVLTQASMGDLKGILAINDEPLVSVDFNHNPASSIVDIKQTRKVGNLIKVLSWYDNEWGFSNRMLDVTKALMSAT